MTTEEADRTCDQFVAYSKQSLKDRELMSIASMNKWMDAFVRSSYFETLKGTKHNVN